MTDHDELDTVALHDRHTELGARMVEFAGHAMPVKYSTVKDEHRAVRTTAGLFDVSHMGRVEIRGDDAIAAIDRLVTHHVASLVDNKALYTVMCNDDGGIIDDLVIYRLAEDRLLLCLNASRRDRDIAHLRAHLKGDAELVDLSDETIQLAVQGPDAESLLAEITDGDLDEVGFFRCRKLPVAGVETLVARTGYTGEDGFELYIPGDGGAKVFDALIEMRDDGLEPCGLGARDTLRLEAGLLLHGQDIDESTTPLEAGLDWLVKFDEKGDFVGRDVLEQQRDQGVQRRLRGLQLQGPGILRSGYPIEIDGTTVGEVTSGGYAPTLEASIGLGYIDTDYDETEEVEVVIRGRTVEAKLVDPPFYDRSN